MVLHGVISWASFRRLPRNGKPFFTTMSLHINNQIAKKRGIWKKPLPTLRAVMLLEHVDLVAGAAHAATIENSPVLLKKPSPKRTCRCHLAPHHCVAQVRCHANGLMYAGFSSHWTHMKSGKYDYTVRFPPSIAPCELEQALSWVLNLIFQHENVHGVKLRDLKFLLINHVFLWKNSFCWKERILVGWSSCKSRRWYSLYFVLHFQLQVSKCPAAPVPTCSIKIPRMKHSSFRCRY